MKKKRMSMLECILWIVIVILSSLLVLMLSYVIAGKLDELLGEVINKLDYIFRVKRV